MSLVSVLYLIFLGMVLLVYYALPQKARPYLLLLSSWAFYAINQGYYLFVLLLSISINYLLCRGWAKHGNRAWVAVSILFNLALLSFFKYLPAIFGFTSLPDGSLLQQIAIPIGLSFFSFQAMGYMLDLHWSGKRQVASMAQYSLFMSFFPQLLAGPIARGKSFIPQISKASCFNYADMVSGSRRILWGLFKKVVIASNLSPYTDVVFQNYNDHQGITIALAAIAYFIQIYMDFSAYSDIAIGSARLFGYRLMENFRVPLSAKSVTDFWRRWHISLSSWVRDYLFLPLQYQTRAWGKAGLITATMITFLVIGVWHGANWTLVIFGVLHGIASTWESHSTELRAKLWQALPKRIGNVLSNLIVFLFIAASAILLRSASIGKAIAIISRIAGSSPLYLGSKQLLVFAISGMLLVFGIDTFKGDIPIDEYIGKQPKALRWALYICLIIALPLIGSLSSENFIYYQY